MELATIFPSTDVLISTGETIAVRPFTFGQIPRAMSLSKGIFGHIQNLMIGGKAIDDVELLGEVLSNGGEQFILLICLSTGKDRAWFDALEALDGLAIATKFLEVNISFFGQKLLPELKKAKTILEKTLPGRTQLLS